MTSRSRTQRVGARAPTFAPPLPVLTPPSPNQATRTPSLDPVHIPYTHLLISRAFQAPSGVHIRREAKP